MFCGNIETYKFFCSNKKEVIKTDKYDKKALKLYPKK